MKVGTFDIETNGFLEQTTKVWCAVIKEHDTGSIRTYTPDNIGDLCNFLDTFDTLIGHNCVGFDFPVLKKIFGWEYTGQVVDTLLMSRLQRPNRWKPKGYIGKAVHSVEAWGYRLGEAKQEHEDWTKFSPAMLERCIGDVQIQSRIYQSLIKEGRTMGWAEAHRLNVKVFHYLHEQEQRGWTIDLPHLDHSMAMLLRWMDRIDRAIVPYLPLIVEEGNEIKSPFKQDGTYSKNCLNYCDDRLEVQHIAGPFSRVAIRTVNIDSNKEVKDFLLSQGWKPEEWNEKEGVRTSAKLSKNDSFKGIRGALGRLVSKRVLCKQRKSVLEGWRSSIRSDEKIGPKVGGIATTGRLRHKGVVNIPSPHSKAFFAKQMRQCFIARPGWVMVGCDSKGNQMRHLAGRMKDDEFTNAVLHGNQSDGTDLHSLNQKRSGASSRSLAKNFFYGSILFGAGPAKTAELLQTTKANAKAIKETYLASMPKLKELLDTLSKEWRLSAKKRFNKKWNKMEYYDGYFRGIDGRSILVPYEKDLLCYALQSDEAIQMAVAYVMVHKRAIVKGWKEGVDWSMLIWMHDEFQMESRPEIADELGRLSCDAIKWAGEFLKINCPHDGDYLIGNNWYDTH